LFIATADPSKRLGYLGRSNPTCPDFIWTRLNKATGAIQLFNKATGAIQLLKGHRRNGDNWVVIVMRLCPCWPLWNLILNWKVVYACSLNSTTSMKKNQTLLTQRLKWSRER